MGEWGKENGENGKMPVMATGHRALVGERSRTKSRWENVVGECGSMNSLFPGVILNEDISIFSGIKPK